MTVVHAVLDEKGKSLLQRGNQLFANFWRGIAHDQRDLSAK